MRALLGLAVLLLGAIALTGCETAAQRQAREAETQEDLSNPNFYTPLEDDLHAD